MEEEQDQNLHPQTKTKPEWLENFITKSFFLQCTQHSGIRKNELNHYCIDCDAYACKHCIASGSHGKHAGFQIYRHVYQDAVRIDDVRKYFDPSSIQPYKSNKQLVITLNPLPHRNSEKDKNACCRICNKKLMDRVRYLYCSIACKVSAFQSKTNDDEPPFLTVQDSANHIQTPQAGTSRRKGVPHRAPRK